MWAPGGLTEPSNRVVAGAVARPSERSHRRSRRHRGDMAVEDAVKVTVETFELTDRPLSRYPFLCFFYCGFQS